MAQRPNMGVPGRFLRHVVDGQIFSYTPAMAGNPAVEEVTEKQAFPERFLTKAQKARKGKLDLSTDDKAVEAAVKPKKKTKADLAADASRGLDKK